MTQDEIIGMAKQAGEEWLKESPTAWETTFNQVPKRYVEIFAQIVASKEREACKAVCEKARYAEQPDYKTSAIQLQQAQPEQEPVAWHVYFGNEDEPNYVCIGEKPVDTRAVIRPLVFGDTTPPQRTWVGLTKEQRYNILREWNRKYHGANHAEHLIDLVEAAHGSKENT